MHLIYSLSLSLSRPFPSRSDRTVVVRLQAAMGAEGVRRRANVTRPLGPHLEARHCPLQQVSRCRHACALVIRCETELQKSIRIYELFRNSWGSENLIHHLYSFAGGLKIFFISITVLYIPLTAKKQQALLGLDLFNTSTSA